VHTVTGLTPFTGLRRMVRAEEAGRVHVILIAVSEFLIKGCCTRTV